MSKQQVSIIDKTKFFWHRPERGAVSIFEAQEKKEEKTRSIKRFICDVADQENDQDTDFLATMIKEAFSTSKTLNELLPPRMRHKGTKFLKMPAGDDVIIIEGIKEGTTITIKRMICEVSEQQNTADKVMLAYGIIAALSSDKTLDKFNN